MQNSTIPILGKPNIIDLTAGIKPTIQPPVINSGGNLTGNPTLDTLNNATRGNNTYNQAKETAGNNPKNPNNQNNPNKISQPQSQGQTKTKPQSQGQEQTQTPEQAKPLDPLNPNDQKSTLNNYLAETSDLTTNFNELYKIWTKGSLPISDSEQKSLDSIKALQISNQETINKAKESSIKYSQALAGRGLIDPATLEQNISQITLQAVKDVADVNSKLDIAYSEMVQNLQDKKFSQAEKLFNQAKDNLKERYNITNEYYKNLSQEQQKIKDYNLQVEKINREQIEFDKNYELKLKDFDLKRSEFDLKRSELSLRKYEIELKNSPKINNTSSISDNFVINLNKNGKSVWINKENGIEFTGEERTKKIDYDNNLQRKINNIVEKINSKSSITGFNSISNISQYFNGSEAKDYVKIVDELKNTLILEAGKNLKGSTSDKDLLFLKDTAARLSTGTTKQEFVNALSELNTYIIRDKKNYGIQEELLISPINFDSNIPIKENLRKELNQLTNDTINNYTENLYNDYNKNQIEKEKISIDTLFNKR